jgi:hypothetical protein
MTMTIAMTHLRDAIRELKSVPQTEERDEVLTRLEEALQELMEIWSKE